MLYKGAEHVSVCNNAVLCKTQNFVRLRQLEGAIDAEFL